MSSLILTPELQPNRWPWAKRHTWMSWRERYKNNEARFDVHIRAFQHKNKLSRQAIPMGSEAMLISGMEDLDDFGTDEEEEDRRLRGGKAARVDSDTEDEDTQPAKTQSRPVRKTVAAPKQPTSKRKRVNDAPDRTSKRTRVINGNGNGDLEGENPTNGPTGEKDVMDQDSQGEETQEVEQNLFCPSDEDSSAIPQWVIPFSCPLSRIHVSSNRAATPAGVTRQNFPPTRLAHQLPGARVLLDLVNQYTDPTVLSTLPLAPSPQLTSMNRTRTHRSSPDALGSEQSQRSSKVRSVATSNPAPFVHLKSTLIHRQALIFLLRGARLGRFLSVWKFATPGRTCLGKNCRNSSATPLNLGPHLHPHQSADPLNHVDHPL